MDDSGTTHERRRLVAGAKVFTAFGPDQESLMNNAKTVASGASQRARKDTKSKVVFKPVLDNPFTVSWPEIPQNVQKSILDATVDLVSCLREYHSQRGLQSRKRKRTRHKDSTADGKDLCLGQDIKGDSDISVDNAEASGQANEGVEPVRDDSTVTKVPPILKHIKFGINEVAKLLESQISVLRQCLLDKRLMEDDDTPRPLVIFACRWDVNPPTLLAHIPHLVASVNTLASTYRVNFTEARPIPEVKLVNLPKGSENPLAEAMGMRRVSVVALNSSAVLGSKLDGLLRRVPRLATPWLIPTTSRTILVPRLELTHVKHLKTTAPIDIRAAKQERIEARKAEKQRRRRRSKATGPQCDPSDMQMVTDP